MSDVALPSEKADPHRLGHDAGARRQAHSASRSDGGPAPKRVVVGYGFWVFLLSDIIMFAAFFASYAVLAGQTAGDRRGISSSICKMPASKQRVSSPRALRAALRALPLARAARAGSTSQWR